MLAGCQKQASAPDMGFPVTEASSLQGTQKNKCLPPHLRTETASVSEVSCSQVFRIPDRRSPESLVLGSPRRRNLKVFQCY